MQNCLRAPFVLVALLTLMAVGSAQQNLGGGRLAGTWDAAISRYDCATGVADPSFQSTANFHKGGTFTGITSGPPPASRTPEVGIWRHESGNTYIFRFKAYMFNPAGVAFAYQIITHRLVLSDDNMSYVSDGEAKIFTINGGQIGSGCSSGVGSRMTFD